MTDTLIMKPAASAVRPIAAKSTRCVWLLLACLALSTTAVGADNEAAPTDAVDLAVVLAQTDKSAALAKLQAIWDDPADALSIKAGLMLSQTQLNQGDATAALVTARAIEEKPGLSTAQTFKAFQLKLLAMTKLREKPASEEALRNQAAQLLAASTVVGQRVDVWIKLGALGMALGQYKQAEDDFLKGLKEVEGATEGNVQRNLYQNLGMARAQQGHFADALDALAHAERINTALGMPDDLDVMLGMSALNIYIEKHQKSVEYGMRAVAVLPEKSPLTTKVYNNLGTAYVGLDDLDAARHWFEKSLAYSDASGTPNPTAINNLGYVLLKLKRPREALTHFETMLAMSLTDKNTAMTAVAKKNLGETWIALGDRLKAAGLLEQARVLYEETDARPNRLELYPILIDNLEALGRNNEALQRMRDFKALSDEVINVDSKERIAALESTIDLGKKEAEIAVQNAELAVQQADLERLREREISQRMQSYGLIALLVGLIGALVMMIRDSRFKARTYQALTEKNREIEAQKSNLQLLNEAVRRQSEEDALTGLNNRHFLREFLAMLDAEDAANGTAGSRQMLAIVADLDHFKAINDEYGHQAGDQVLRHFADLLRRCKRADDVLVRWGGEEFIWLCMNTSVEAGPALCDRLRLALMSEPVTVDAQVITATVSLGFAPIPVWKGSVRDAELGLKLADHAVYLAKESGRNRWVGYLGHHAPEENFDAARQVDALEAAGYIVKVQAGGSAV